jgi:phenylacetate-CoA ligase
MTTALPLDPIETASRDELAALQLERLKWSLNHAYENSPVYRRKFDEAGVHPSEVKTLADLARFPFTTKKDLRDSYPFGMFAVPQEQISRIHASSGTTGKPTVVGYTARDIDTFDPCRRREARRQGPRKLRLWFVHRRPRRTLRRRACRTDRDPVRRWSD